MRAKFETGFGRLMRTLYPESFAGEFGSEMAGVFADGLDAARDRGRLSAARFVVRELWSLVEGALVAHADDSSPRPTHRGRAARLLALLLDAPWAPFALAFAALVSLGALAGDLVAARGLYWRATQLGLVALLAGVALRLGAALVRDPRPLTRSLSILLAAALAAAGTIGVGAADEAITIAAASAGDARFDASLPGVRLRVATGDAARSGNVAPPAGFAPTRIRSQSVERDGLAVRTQLFARGVDLAYALVAMTILAAAAAAGARISRDRPRLA